MYKNFFAVLLAFTLLFVISGCKDDSTPPPSGSTGNHPPNAPSNPVPNDGATNVTPGIVDLRWSCSDPDPGDVLTYNVYAGSSATPTNLVSQNQQSTSYSYTVGPFSTIYWKIVARDDHGDSTAGPIWRFRTTN